jgi:probable addiction module antidote protein
MTPTYRTWEETQIEHFRKHPEQIPLLLNIGFEQAEKSGEWGAFLHALRTVAEAQGGLGVLAEKLGCSRTTLYRTLSSAGNPRLETLGAILRVFGLRLGVEPLPPAKAKMKKRAKAATSKQKSAVGTAKRREPRVKQDSPSTPAERVARG